ncbi:hypothetical protein Tco_1337923 [Tanacetum coccineum]
MAQQPMRSEEELCPTHLRCVPNKSNVRIDLDETQDEPLFDISLEILKNNTNYNALTLTTKGRPQELTQHGIGKGLMQKGDVPIPKKKKDVVPRRQRIITFSDNVLLDPDEALEYAKMVNMEEAQHQEKERQTKQRHARIMLERQVNKEVDEGYQHLKVKLKSKEQPSPEAQLLLNLKKQGKESNKQAILEEIKRKDTREGSDHDESDNDSEHGDASDKSASDE